MAEFIVRPAEHVDTPRLRVELRGPDYVVFGEAVEGEESVTEYRTEDRDIAEALRDNPLLSVEAVATEGESEVTNVRPLKADIVNEYADGEVDDGDEIRDALYPETDEPAARPATSVETAPTQPDPPKDQDPVSDWNDHGGTN